MVLTTRCVYDCFVKTVISAFHALTEPDEDAKKLLFQVDVRVVKYLKQLDEKVRSLFKVFDATQIHEGIT